MQLYIAGILTHTKELIKINYIDWVLKYVNSYIKHTMVFTKFIFLNKQSYKWK